MEISNSAIGLLAAVCIGGGAGTTYLISHDSSPALVAEDAPVVAESPAPLAAPADEADDVEADTGTTSIIPSPDTAATPVRATAAPAIPPPAPGRSSTSAGQTVPTQAPRQSTARPADDRPAPPAAAASRTPSADAATPSTPIPTPSVAFSSPAESTAAAPPELPEPRYEDLEIAANSVIGLQVDTAVSSEQAQVEDEVIAHVTRDVKVAGRVAIPAGAKAHGDVVLVERGGRVRDRARLGVRFTSIVLADGTRVPIATETIYREGDAPGAESSAKIGGGAIGGAILGGIFGGAKGAAIGSALGGGAGSAAVMAGGRNPATLAPGAPVTVRLQQPTTVTVERE